MAPPASGTNSGWLAQPAWASAWKAYVPDDQGCLPLSEGQWVYVQYVGEGENANWNYGTDESGASVGWFPADIVVFYDGEDDASSTGEAEGHRMSLATPTKNSRPSASASSPRRGQKIEMPVSSRAEQIESDPAKVTSGGQLTMLSGKAQREEARRLADLQAKPLDDSAKQAIAERRALSQERRTAAECEASKRANGQSELEARLARRRALSDGETTAPAPAAPDSAPLPQPSSDATVAEAADATERPADPVAGSGVAPPAGVAVTDARAGTEPAADLPAPSPAREENIGDGGDDDLGPAKSKKPACGCCAVM